MSPMDSCFCLASNRRMIHPCTIATRARVGVCTCLVRSSSTSSSGASSPRILSFCNWRTLLRFCVEKAQGPGVTGCQRRPSESAPTSVALSLALWHLGGSAPVGSTLRLTSRFLKSASQRRCNKASACSRLKRCVISLRKSTCTEPEPLHAPSASLRYGLLTSPGASNATAMQAPSNHFALILCTASRASHHRWYAKFVRKTISNPTM
mmetsp:Transcript_92095/g.214046  ORF Transcript_92095/g.214046 Transcript_92095/m.214046 type:complete len:208 (-) Transcript_92095:239-862(-)